MITKKEITDMTKVKETIKAKPSKKAKKRGKQDKREVPAWALLEFSRKLSELNEKLKINRRTLESQVQSAISSLGKEERSTSVTYH